MNISPHIQDDLQVTYSNGLGFIPQVYQKTTRKNQFIQHHIILLCMGLLLFLRVVSFRVLVGLWNILGLPVRIPTGTGMFEISDMERQLWDSACLFLYLGVPCLILWGCCRLFLSQHQSVHRNTSSIRRYAVWMVIGCSVLVSSMTSVLVGWLESRGILLEQTHDLPAVYSSNVVFYLFTVAILPAVLEEILFRGMILSVMRGLGEKLAIVASSVLYAITQSTAQEMLYAGMMGFILGYVTIQSGDILLAMGSSIMIKGLPVGLRIMEQHSSPELFRVARPVLLCGLVIAGLFALVRWIKNKPHNLALSQRNFPLSYQDKMNCIMDGLGVCLLVFWTMVQMIKQVQLIG